MKIGRAITLLFLTVILTFCGSSATSPGMNPTEVLATALPPAMATIVETQTAMPTATLPPSPVPFVFVPTTRPGPYFGIRTPNPDQQVYTDPDGWYSVNFPADMEPTDKPNVFSRPGAIFETGYLPEMGYVSWAQIVCAWLGNIEFKPEESIIDWYYSGNDFDFPPRPRCSVSTTPDDEHETTKYDIFLNPGADPQHRFIFIKTVIKPDGKLFGASFSWLKPVYDIKADPDIEPLSPDELSFWENAGSMPTGVSVTEYVLPPEAQAGPYEKMLLGFVPKELLPERAVKKPDSFATPYKTPTVEEKLGTLGYVFVTQKNPWRQQLFQDGVLLFDNVYKISDIYKFSTDNGSITAFVVYTLPKGYGTHEFNGFLIQNDKISPWEYNHQDPYPAPVLYQNELLWVKATKDFDYIQVINSNREVIYSFAVYTEPLYAVSGFSTWNGHWILEARDFLIQDGEIVNQKLGFQEIFNWGLVKDKPTYFFRKGSRVGISYDGQILPLQYQDVAHGLCCGYAINNPYVGKHSVNFFGKKDGVWYYVVVKFD